MKVVTLAQRPEFAGQASGAVQAPLPQWRARTGLAFDHDGEVIVPGALAPVLVSTRRDIGAYGEPNVWVLRPTWLMTTGSPAGGGRAWMMNVYQAGPSTLDAASITCHSGLSVRS